MNNLIAYAYWIYLPIMIGLTVWVARIIHKNSKAFLVEIFPEHEQVALSVNNLLQMGFYLISLGYGFFHLKIQNSYYVQNFMTTQQELVESLAYKLGGFTLFVGALLFFNLILMLILRKNAKHNRLREEQLKNYRPPVPPQYPQTPPPLHGTR